MNSNFPAQHGWTPDNGQLVSFALGSTLLLHVIHSFFFSQNAAVNHTHIVIDSAMWLMFPCNVIHYFFPTLSLLFMGSTMVFLIFYLWKVEKRRPLALLSMAALVVLWEDYKVHTKGK